MSIINEYRISLNIHLGYVKWFDIHPYMPVEGYYNNEGEFSGYLEINGDKQMFI